MTKDVRIPFAWKIHLSIAVLTIAVVSCLGYVYQMGARINAQHTPMVNAAHHVGEDTTLFHLWIEEMITGNPTLEQDDIFQYLDTAMADTVLIISGSSKYTDYHISFDNPELKQVASSVLSDLKDFRQIAEDRLASIGPDGISPLDDFFDGTFDVIMTQTDDMESILEGMVTNQLNAFARLQIVLIVACVISGLMVGAMVRRFERQRYLYAEEKLCAQDALQTSKERLSLAMRASGAGIIDQTLHPRVEGSVNARWAEILGYSKDELPSLDANFLDWWASLLHPDDLPKFKRARQQLIEGKVSNYEIEARHRHKSGAWLYLMIYCRAGNFDKNGRVTRIVGMIIDKTRNKMSEMENTRLATVVKQSGEAVIILDIDGLIQYANPAFERMSGYPGAEVLGKSLDMVERSEPKTQARDHMWKLLRDGKPWSGILANQRKNGEGYEVAQTISPIMNIDGHATGYAVVQRDVTFERQLQAKMEHSDRLESLGVLAGGIAHDFNNLLTAIMGNSSIAMMKLQTQPAVTSKGRTSISEHLQRIEDSCKSAADLCKQMLAYSGKGKFEVRPVDLSTVVGEMSKLMAVSISKNSEIIFDLADNLPAVEADSAQLQQVIMNLLTNASEAIDEQDKGMIRVSTGVMQASKAMLACSRTNMDLPEGQYVYLRVNDNGCGMDAATRKKIFEPFFTTKFTGRGLGMSAMLGIVQGHSGALTLESRPGTGSSFTVMFPSMEADVQPAKEMPANVTNLADWRTSGSVLVIDDDEAIRETASVMISAKGFTVLTAEDGRQGLEVFRQHQGEIVVVLLDMTMPNMNGEECFRELKRIRPDVKVLLSSGYTEDDATSSFSGLGLAGFIQKPYAADHLHHSLRQALDA
ncbi:MAG: PAS domain S-box protein [Mariprofundaceae bacterium]